MNTQLLASMGRFLSGYGLETLWQSALLLPIFIVLSRLLRRHAARVRARLWLTFLLFIPLMPFVTQWAGDAGLPQRSAASSPLLAVKTPMAPPAMAPTPEPTPTPPAQRISAPASSAPPVQEITPNPVSGTFSPAPPRRLEYNALLSITYLLLATFFLARISMGYSCIYHWLHNARPCEEERVLEAFDRAARQSRRGKGPRIRVSPHINSPATVSLGRTTTLIPEGFADALNELELFAVAVHETEHANRRDAAFLFLIALTRALFWFHPLIWWLSRRIAHCMEENADEAVLHATGAADPYAHLLARLAETACLERTPASVEAVGLLWRADGLPARIGAVLTGGRRRLKPAMLILVTLTLLAGVGMVSAAPLRRMSDRAAVRQAARNLPDPMDIERVLRFEVYDNATGELLPECSYWATNFGHEERQYTAVGGVFEHVLSAGTVVPLYSVTAPGYGEQTWRLYLTNNLDTTVPVTVRLDKARTVSGRVVNEEGGPIQDAHISLSASSANGHALGRMAYSSKTVTNGLGRWSFADVPPDFERLSFILKHPDYVDDVYFGRDVRENHTGEIEHIMKRGAPFTGRVVDMDGNGISGVLVQFRFGHSVSAESDENGHFIWPHCDESYFNSQTLVARAAGYAEQYLRLSPGDWHDAYEIRLSPGKPLRVQFLKPDGSPLADAEVFASLSTVFDNQVHYFSDKTDASGVLVVEDAPEEVFWDFNVRRDRDRQQFQRVSKLALAPGEGPHTIQLKTLPSVTMLVEDSVTGRPLDAFSVTRGYLVANPCAPPTRRGWWRATRTPVNEIIDWQNHSRESCSRVFRSAYDDYSDRAMLYRVEAEGYYPVQTRAFSGGDGDQLFRVRMKPGDMMRVRAVDASGVLLGDAQAAWARKGKGLMLWDGEFFERHHGLTVVSALPDGCLVLPPAERSEHALTVVSDYGAAVVDAETLRFGQDIALLPWGRMEGVMTPRIARFAEGGVRMGCTLSLCGVNIAFDTTVSHDDKGRFVAEKLYPGTYWIGPVNRYGGGHVSSPVAWGDFSVASGETAQVSMSGGRGVKGRLDMPDEAWMWFRKKPLELYVSRQEAPDKTPSMYRSAYMKANVDGEVWIEALPPGDYSLRRNTITNPDIQGSQPVRFVVPHMRFTIDDNPELEDVPLDLGVIVVTERSGKEERPALKAGDAAPEFSVTTLSGEPLSLSAFRGRHVLLDFWATWCGPCRKETPYLKAAWERYGDRDDFILIGLSLDNDPKALKQYLDENDISWPQAFLDGWAGSDIPEAYGVSGIPRITLIDPDGRIVHPSLRGRAIGRALRKALRK